MQRKGRDQTDHALRQYADHQSGRPVAEVREYDRRAVKRYRKQQVDHRQSPEKQLALHQDRGNDSQRREQQRQRKRAQQPGGIRRKIGPELYHPRSARKDHGSDARDQQQLRPKNARELAPTSGGPLLNQRCAETRVAEQREERQRELHDPEHAELARTKHAREVNRPCQHNELLQRRSATQNQDPPSSAAVQRRAIEPFAAVLRRGGLDDWARRLRCGQQARQDKTLVDEGGTQGKQVQSSGWWSSLALALRASVPAPVAPDSKISHVNQWLEAGVLDTCPPCAQCAMRSSTMCFARGLVFSIRNACAMRSASLSANGLVRA